MTKPGVLGESATRLIDRIDYDVLRAMLHARQLASPTAKAVQHLQSVASDRANAGPATALRSLIGESVLGDAAPFGGAFHANSAAGTGDSKQT